MKRRSQPPAPRSQSAYAKKGKKPARYNDYAPLDQMFYESANSARTMASGSPLAVKLTRLGRSKGDTIMSTVRETWAMICPDCNSDENLQVDVVCRGMADLTPDGTDFEPGDQEWDEASMAECICGWSGIVEDCQNAADKSDRELNDGED